jgi:hypothetical protein
MKNETCKIEKNQKWRDKKEKEKQNKIKNKKELKLRIKRKRMKEKQKIYKQMNRKNLTEQSTCIYSTNR